MDTILVQRPQFEKAATSAAGIGIAICLLLSQNTLLSAKDLGNLTGISPTLNYVQEQQRHQETIFEESKRICFLEKDLHEISRKQKKKNCRLHSLLF